MGWVVKSKHWFQEHQSSFFPIGNEPIIRANRNTMMISKADFFHKGEPSSLCGVRICSCCQKWEERGGLHWNSH